MKVVSVGARGGDGPDRAGARRIPRRRLFRALLALGTVAAAARPTTVRGYLIGCYTRPWDQFELETALDGIAEAGYAYAGLMTARGRSPAIVTPETSEDEAARVGEKVRNRGLKVCSVYGDFAVGASPREGEDRLRRLIDNCAASGSQELLLGGTADAGEHDRYFEVVAKLCDYAVTKRVGLTIKPHGGLIATGAQCREVIEKVRHPVFRLWYDPGNIFYYSDGRRDPLQDVVEVDGLVVGMSVKDFRPPKDVFVTPGTGRVNFPVLIARLRLGGFTRGQLVVECTARGDARQVTEEARKARLFVERLARERGMDTLRPTEGTP